MRYDASTSSRQPPLGSSRRLGVDALEEHKAECDPVEEQRKVLEFYANQKPSLKKEPQKSMSPDDRQQG